MAILHAKRLDRIGYHAWRGALHLIPGGSLPQGATEADAVPSSTKT
jgi:hypothetical protein